MTRTGTWHFGAAWRLAWIIPLALSGCSRSTAAPPTAAPPGAASIPPSAAPSSAQVPDGEPNLITQLMKAPAAPPSDGDIAITHFGRYQLTGILQDGSAEQPGTDAAPAKGTGYPGLALDHPITFQAIAQQKGDLTAYPALTHGKLHHIQLQMTEQQASTYKQLYGKHARVDCDVDFVGRYYTPIYCGVIDIQELPDTSDQATTSSTSQTSPSSAGGTPSLPTTPEHVDPAALMALPGDYEGRVVSFTVQASAGLQRNSDGTSSVYIDDYEHLSPVLQGDVLRKWLNSKFAPDGVYTITFIGRVEPDAGSPFVRFNVEDFSIN